MLRPQIPSSLPWEHNPETSLHLQGDRQHLLSLPYSLGLGILLLWVREKILFLCNSPRRLEVFIHSVGKP